MKTRSVLAFAAPLAAGLLAASPALAASRPDVGVSISTPAGTHVYQSAAYTFTVNNTGNKNASGVVLTVYLPETNTSPTVHVMGTLGTFDARCTRTGTVLTCNLGTLVKFTGTTVVVNLALPYAFGPLVLDAHVSTTTAGETNLANNDASLTANLATYDVAVAAPEYAVNEHCTGTGLTSFFECALYPSSIASFDSVLNLDTSVTLIDAPPGYGGQWSMPDTDHLVIDFWDDVGPVGSIDARGVSADCFEGPFDGGGSYTIPYRICLQ